MPTIYWCPHQLLKATGVPGVPAMVQQKNFLTTLLDLTTHLPIMIDHCAALLRSQIWRIHFWNWWSHGVTQCESLTPINIQWELWPFSKFVVWPWGQLYIYFFTICSRRYILEMQKFFWIAIVSTYFMLKIFWNCIPTWNSYLDFPLGGVHKLLWDIFGPPTHLFLSK